MTWRVRRLDLSWCGLTRLPSMLPTSYSDWAAVTSLDLRHNPWQCDCHAQWLLAGLVPAMYNNTPDMLHGD